MDAAAWAPTGDPEVDGCQPLVVGSETFTKCKGFGANDQGPTILRLGSGASSLDSERNIRGITMQHTLSVLGSSGHLTLKWNPKVLV